MGEKFKVSFTLDEEDAEYFRGLYRKVRKGAATQDPEQIIKDARDIVHRVRSSKKTPNFVIEAISVFLPAKSPSSSMHSMVMSVESMSIARSLRSAKRRPSGIQAWSMRRASHKGAIPSLRIACVRRYAPGAPG